LSFEPFINSFFFFPHSPFICHLLYVCRVKNLNLNIIRKKHVWLSRYPTFGYGRLLQTVSRSLISWIHKGVYTYYFYLREIFFFFWKWNDKSFIIYYRVLHMESLEKVIIVIKRIRVFYSMESDTCKLILNIFWFVNLILSIFFIIKKKINLYI
jgi:hypothetical protein